MALVALTMKEMSTHLPLSFLSRWLRRYEMEENGFLESFSERSGS